MNRLKRLKKEYLDSRSSPYEGGLEWFLKRKLGFWGKIGVAYLLWFFWLVLMTHPIYFLYLFYAVILLSILVISMDAYMLWKKKRDHTFHHKKEFPK